MVHERSKKGTPERVAKPGGSGQKFTDRRRLNNRGVR